MDVITTAKARSAEAVGGENDRSTVKRPKPSVPFHQPPTLPRITSMPSETTPLRSDDRSYGSTPTAVSVRSEDVVVPDADLPRVQLSSRDFWLTLTGLFTAIFLGSLDTVSTQLGHFFRRCRLKADFDFGRVW